MHAWAPGAGDPRPVAADVARILGHQETNRPTRGPDDDKGRTGAQAPGRGRPSSPGPARPRWPLPPPHRP